MNDSKTTIDLQSLDASKVLWAAMCAMIQDIHSPQDQLTELEWALADKIFEQLNVTMDKETP